LKSLSRDPHRINVHPMKTASIAPLLFALAGFSILSGCDKKPQEQSAASDKTPAGDSIDPGKAAEKKAKIDALLRENGIDPASIKEKSAGEIPSSGAGPAKSTHHDASTKKPGALVEVLTPGTGPLKVLRYQFKEGQVRKFSMQMEIVPTRTVNGQPMPSIPAVKIEMLGTSKTLSFVGHSAQRQNTFSKVTPGTDGLPPAIAEQMLAQFSGLKGIELLETVSDTGQVLDMSVRPGSNATPQVVAMMQNLQDGMSNAFLPLPSDPVGPGAKWRATTQVSTAGLTIQQVNEVELLSLKGAVATVALTFSQSAAKQIIQAPGLPPGAQVELISMKGGGTGKMRVDLSSLVTESNVDLTMTVDTKISGPAMPQPVLSATSTSMKIKMKVSK